MSYRQFRFRPVACLLCLVVAMTAIGPLGSQRAAADFWSPPRTVWVAETGHTVDNLFLDIWRENDTVFGNPITEEFALPEQAGIDAYTGLTVQFFERVAIAYVPDAGPGNRVQFLPIGQQAFGNDRERYPSRFPGATPGCDGLSPSDCTLVEGSDHTVRWGFKAFWEAAGGAGVLGLPLSEEVKGKDGWRLQYFENVVLRWKKKSGVSAQAAGAAEARRLKLATTGIPQPDGMPQYSADLFVAPPGGFLGLGPGSQQGTNKEIVIDISDQAMWAYEGGSLVINTLVSTGTGNVPETVTPLGYHFITWKTPLQTMKGVIADEAYEVEDVPWVMYFDEAGNALHGAYWHNNFGTPMSHGCVNLPLDVAEFLYGWAPEGTAVTVLA